MSRMKSLVYLASRVVFFHCYGIIRNLMNALTFIVCVMGIKTVSESLLQDKFIVVFLVFIKNILLKIYKSWKSLVCLNILKDLVEILSVNPTVYC